MYFNLNKPVYLQPSIPKIVTHIVSFIFAMGIVMAQDNIHCSEIRSLIKVENSADVPTITNNNNDNTITLTFPQQDINDIFSNYVITDFYQAIPNGSENLQKYYYVKHYNKDLIVDIINNISASIILTDEAPSTTISQDLIDILDGKTFAVTKYVTDNGNCTNEFGIIDCPYINVPEGTNISFTFTYNQVDDRFLVESSQLSPCGNFFSSYLKGGDPNDVDFDFVDYSLQT